MDGNSQEKTLSQNDDGLAILAKSGDDTALTDLIERYAPLVRVKAKGFAKGALDADDLFQEGMLALLKAVRNYRIDAAGSFRTFASVCIVNKMSSVFTAHMRDKNAPMRGYISLSESETSGDSFAASRDKTDPELLVIQSEEAALRNRCIETLLSPFERQVLRLYLSSYSYDEMSQSLGSTAKAVDNALQRVRRKLRNVFNVSADNIV